MSDWESDKNAVGIPMFIYFLCILNSQKQVSVCHANRNSHIEYDYERNIDLGRKIDQIVQNF